MGLSMNLLGFRMCHQDSMIMEDQKLIVRARRGVFIFRNRTTYGNLLDDGENFYHSGVKKIVGNRDKNSIRGKIHKSSDINSRDKKFKIRNGREGK